MNRLVTALIDGAKHLWKEIQAAAGRWLPPSEIPNETGDELFAFEVKLFEYLLHAGYTVSREQHCVTYSSRELIFRIREQRYWDSPTSKLLDAKTEAELPHPMEALTFYLEDYESEWKEVNSMFPGYSRKKRGIAAYVELCKRNPWIFATTAWTKAADLIEASRKTNEWALGCLSEGITFPNYDDIIRKMRSFRTANTRVPEAPEMFT